MALGFLRVEWRGECPVSCGFEQLAHVQCEKNGEQRQQIESHSKAQPKRPLEPTCGSPNYKPSHAARDDPARGSQRGEPQTEILDAIIGNAANLSVRGRGVEVVTQHAQGERRQPAEPRGIRQSRGCSRELRIGFRVSHGTVSLLLAFECRFVIQRRIRIPLCEFETGSRSTSEFRK